MGNTKDFLELDENSSALLDLRGREINSRIPKYAIIEDRKDTELERIRKMVRVEMSLAAQKHGFETFDEANDFDVEDDFEYMPELAVMKDEYINFPPRESARSGAQGSPPPENGGEPELPADSEV